MLVNIAIDGSYGKGQQKDAMEATPWLWFFWGIYVGLTYRSGFLKDMYTRYNYNFKSSKEKYDDITN